MAQQVRAFAAKPNKLCSIPRRKHGRKRADFHKFPADLHICASFQTLSFFFPYDISPLIFKCLSVLPARMSVYLVFTWWPWSPEEGVISPRTGVIASWALSYGCWESNPGFLQEQKVLLSTGPSLSSAPLAKNSWIQMILCLSPLSTRKQQFLCSSSKSNMCKPKPGPETKPWSLAQLWKLKGTGSVTRSLYWCSKYSIICSHQNHPHKFD